MLLTELGRGTATFDGQSLAEAILHQLATHTLPIGFFSTHYHTLTEAYLSPKPHPNVRCQHMATHVNDERREVIPLYKLIDGVAESSFGTRELSSVHDLGVRFADGVDDYRCGSPGWGTGFDRDPGRIGLQRSLCGSTEQVDDEASFQALRYRSSR